MLLAGAGTGKTRVITYRIAHMLDRGIPADQIVALTFTNKAAREMNTRLTELVGGRSKNVLLGTFHSYCIKILRRYHEQAELSANFGLAGTSDQIELVRKSIEELGWTAYIKPAAAHHRISQAKNQLISPDDINQLARDQSFVDPAMMTEIYKLYERQLRLNRVIDFDDCIFRTVHLLNLHEDVRQDITLRHRRFLVDEFQDTNFSQLRILELLAKDHRHLCVVGDDDQSIYSWRGAMPETLIKFEEIFPEALQITLDQNYRCTNVILDGANSVIVNNPKRKPKKLWSESRGQEKIAIANPVDDVAEARHVAQKILAWRGRGLGPDQIGILYRANSQARALELALREHRVPYRVFGGQSLFEKKEIKDVLSYLRLVGDPDHRLSFWRIINLPARGLGLKSLEAIESASIKAHCSPFEALEKGLVDLPHRSQEAASKFCDQIRSLHLPKLEHPEQVADLTRRIIKTFALEQEYRQKAGSVQQASYKLETLRQLPDWLAGVAEPLAKEGAFGWKDFMDSLSLGDEPPQRDQKNQQPAVSLMTIHAAKGLEFPLVFLVGVEEDLIPHKNSLEDRAIDEERRLFYVAMTRAKIKLYLSHCQERQVGRQRLERNPSRFIQEIPAEVTELEGEDTAASQQTTQQRQAATNEKLGSLRSLLKSGFREAGSDPQHR